MPSEPVQTIAKAECHHKILRYWFGGLIRDSTRLVKNQMFNSNVYVQRCQIVDAIQSKRNAKLHIYLVTCQNYWN